MCGRLRPPGRCLPGTVSWSDGARGRLDEMSSVWEEEGRERNWRGRPAPFSSSSSPPPSLQSDSWNAPDIKWFVQSHNAAGKGADARAEAGEKEGVYQGTHLVGIIASHRALSPSCVGRCLCARPPLPIRDAHGKGGGRKRRCLSSGTYSTVRVWSCTVSHVVLGEGLRRPRSTLAQIRIVDLYVANGLRAPRRETHWE